MKKMLFWKGRGTPDGILESFLTEASKYYEITSVPFRYDVGDPPFYDKSEWANWLKSNQFDHWCGLSLGASLMYVMASVCSECCPHTLTMINPFFSRKILSDERGFSMTGQWDMELKDYLPAPKRLNIVLSVYDTKIPMWHGAEIINRTPVMDKRLILVKSDHVINRIEAQTELANIIAGDDINDKKDKYCYIYKRQ